MKSRLLLIAIYVLVLTAICVTEMVLIGGSDW